MTKKSSNTPIYKIKKEYIQQCDERTRVIPSPLIKKDKCVDFEQIWFSTTSLKIILFLMKNNNMYYTREEIANNSFIRMSTLERYLPKLANSHYNLIIERLTVGNTYRANHVKEYHINPASSIIQTLYKLLEEIKKFK